ncbi:MAG: Mur ligase family protein [bacterium]
METFKTKFLYSLSKKILKKYHPDVIGIVGSVGKTTTQEAIYSVLSSKFNVRKNSSKGNNKIEIIFSIIGADSKRRGWYSLVFHALKLLIIKDSKYPDILVLEIDVKKPGDLERLTEYIPFHIGMITSSEAVQPSAFSSAKKLAAEYEIMISRLPKDGIAILNVDDEMVKGMKTKASMMTLGVINDADLKANEPAISVNNEEADGLPIKGISFKINYKGSVVPILIPEILGTHQIYSVLAAIMCGLVYQMNLSEISNNLREYHPPAGRMRLLKGIKNTLIIDDTFSSSSVSVKAALGSLALIPLKENVESYAVIGDIMDLGNMSEDIHREIGHYAEERGIDKIITVGERSKDVAVAAREAGMEEDKVFSFDDVLGAGKFLQKRLEKNDVVLITGSAAMEMEKIVKELMADPLLSKHLLINCGK